MLKLSNDQKRRIEQEEQVRLAEEQHRAKVREGLVTEPDRGSGRGGLLPILLILGIVVYIAILNLR